jgi:hypothetical protein
LLLGILLLAQRQLPSGVLSSFSLSLIALGALGLSFTRGDPSRMIGEIRVDGLAAGGILLLGTAGILVNLWGPATKEKT